MVSNLVSRTRAVPVSFMAALFMAALFIGSAQAAIDAYPFPNDELSKRYNALIAELRCPQCLNTNIAGSDAMIARDLRRETHRLLLEGKDDDEIRRFMRARYGDFILYDPPLNAGTLALWFGPALFFVIAAVVLFRLLRRRQKHNVVLTGDDEARLAQLLKK